MIVQSPLKKHDIRPNMRRVPKPDGQTKATGSGSSGKSPRQKIKVPKVKPWKVILSSIVLATLGVLYLTHVFATQKMLEEVKELEAEYNVARSAHDELKLRYDRMIGPSEIYDKAADQGFVNGGPAEKVIIIRE